MDTRYEITFEGRVVTVAVIGHATGPAILNALRAAMEDPRYVPGMTRIWDFRHISSLDLMPDDVKSMRQQGNALRPQLGGGPSAVVMNPYRTEDLPLLELFRVYFAGRPILTFNDLDAARAWAQEQPAG